MNELVKKITSLLKSCYGRYRMLTGVFLLGVLILLSQSSFAAKDDRLGKNLKAWTERVIPLPKEIAVKDSMIIRAGEIKIHPYSSDAPQIKTALGLFNGFTQNEIKNVLVEISMELTGDKDSRVPEQLRERLSKLPNKEQAYAILSLEGKKKSALEIIVVANAPTGLLYGARTLEQLLKLDDKILADTELEVPVVSIVDWPDIKERGMWGASCAEFMPWTSRWKLNLVERYAHAYVNPKTGNFELGTGDAGYLPRAESLGMKFIPYVPHLPGVLPRMCRELPRLASESKREHYKPLMDGFCFSKPEAIDLLEEIMILQINAVKGYHNELEIWFSESHSDQKLLFQKTSPGEDSYILETKALLKAFERVKKKYPGIRLRLGLTQGTHKDTGRIIDLLPPDVGLQFYHSELTYNNYRRPMIYPLLEKFSLSGSFLGVFPEFTASHRTVVPYTGPQFVRYRLQELAEKKLSSVSGFFVPNIRYHDFNVVAMAEWSWNAHGRSPKDFARAYATVTGVCEPGLFAQWALKSGEVGWELARSRFFNSLLSDFSIGFYGSVPFGHNPKVKDMLTVENKKKKRTVAKKALQLAQRSGNSLMIVESEFVLNALEAFQSIDVISNILHSSDIDKSAKKALTVQMDRFDIAAHGVRLSLLKWRDMVAPGQQVHYRLKATTMALIHTADVIRAVSARLGIPDRMKAFRPMEIYEWRDKDFPDKAATLKIDITDLVPHQGGEYNVVFDLLDTSLTKINSIELTGVFADTSKRKTLSRSPDAGGTLWLATGNMPPFAECRIFIPQTPPGTELFLEIAMEVPSQPRAGLISLRRVWYDDFNKALTEQESFLRQFSRKQSHDSDNIFQNNDAGQKSTSVVRVGVTEGVGAEQLLIALNNTKNVNAFTIKGLNNNSLGKCDVLVIPQARTPLRLIRASSLIIDWVNNGGGILFLHDAVGYRKHMAMFKELGGGVDHPKLHTVRVKEKHPVTSGLSVGQVFSPGYRYDHVILKPGPSGEVVIENEQKNPVVVVGKSGRGRVVLNGMCTGISSKKNNGAILDKGPVGEELEVLVNSVFWLAGRRNE